MESYKSFNEYLEKNYLKEFKERFYGIGKKVSEVKVKKVQFLKSEIENVEFSAELFGDDTDLIVFMKGSFSKGFEIVDECMDNNNIYSSMLVPIIKKEEMEKYATRFLEEFFPLALIEPTKINVNEVLKEKGINVYYAPLEDDVFGEFYFASNDVEVYEDPTLDKSSKTITKHIDKGTILINLDKAIERVEGFYRNTMIHEAVHWFYHRNYFELACLLGNNYDYIECYRNENNVKKKVKEISWMEWQARTLTPKILMPCEMAKKKYYEILDEANLIFDSNDEIKKLEYVLNEFKEFFGVSTFSARIRLLELGIYEIEGINNFIDDRYVSSYVFRQNVLLKNQTFCISKKHLNELRKKDMFIKYALDTKKIVYTNSMLVINDEKYFDSKNNLITNYALNNASECCFIFNIRPNFVTDDYQDYEKTLYSSKKFENFDVSIEQKYAYNIFKSTLEGNEHFEKHKKELPDSFGKTLRYHFKKAKENNLFRNLAELEDASDVSERAIRDYILEKYVPKRDVVIKLCLALRLSTKYFLDMLEKSDNIINYNYEDNSFFLTIAFGYQRQGLINTYKVLDSINKGYLLNLSPK